MAAVLQQGTQLGPHTGHTLTQLHIYQWQAVGWPVCLCCCMCVQQCLQGGCNCWPNCMCSACPGVLFAPCPCHTPDAQHHSCSVAAASPWVHGMCLCNCRLPGWLHFTLRGPFLGLAGNCWLWLATAMQPQACANALCRQVSSQTREPLTVPALPLLHISAVVVLVACRVVWWCVCVLPCALLSCLLCSQGSRPCRRLPCVTRPSPATFEEGCLQVGWAEVAS